MGLVEVGKVGMTEEGNGLYNFDQLGDGEMESVLRRKRKKKKKSGLWDKVEEWSLRMLVKWSQMVVAC